MTMLHSWDRSLTPLPSFEGPLAEQPSSGCADCDLCGARAQVCFRLGPGSRLVEGSPSGRAPARWGTADGTIACVGCLRGGSELAVVLRAEDGLRRSRRTALPSGDNAQLLFGLLGA